MLWMKRNAYADSTIKATAKRLKHLQKHCYLTQPEDIISVLKKHPTAYKNTKKYTKTALEKIKKLDSLFK
jgi:hypothetical protein